MLPSAGRREAPAVTHDEGTVDRRGSGGGGSAGTPSQGRRACPGDPEGMSAASAARHGDSLRKLCFRSETQKFRAMLMPAGPRTTTNRAGKMQNTMGMSIFTGAFWAFS